MFILYRPGARLCFAAIAAAALTCCPLRAAQPKTASGVIVGKTFRPAGIYRQYPGGRREGLRDPSEIPIAESVVFEIRVEGLGTVRYPLNTVAVRGFASGQKVQIVYVRRAIVPLRTRVYVREMRHAE